MLDLDTLLKTMVQEGASDMILKTGGYPAIRAQRLVRYISDEKIESEFARSVLSRLLDEDEIRVFKLHGEADKALSIPEVGRFRVNIFRQSGEPGFVFRYVRRDVPVFRDLNLPVEQMKKLAGLHRGLVLATGIAGSGKSTTLASVIEHINRTMHRHVVTVEDPIEFLFEDKLSIVNQREIGLDCESFGSALKHVVRQSPDVIMIGEMRDRETVEAAISAAETGHLVLSTLHTVNAIQTVERIISFFPENLHELIRLQLSMNLAGVISLRLIRLKDNRGLVPAIELLMSTPSVKEILAEGRTRDLAKTLAEGSYYGTMTFNQSLLRLYEAGNISYEEALAASDNPDELKLQIRGITSGVTLGKTT